MSTAPSASTQIDALDTTLVTGVGDACSGCGARLSAEQRYCVECGERRGQSRLPFADALGQRAQAAAPPPPPRKQHRLTANGALIAGIGTLILALGVGVLIGRSGNNGGSSKAAAPQVIRVSGGGATGAGNTTASTGGSGGGGGKSKKTANGGGDHSKKPIAAQTVQKKGSNVPPPAVKVGSPGHGKGYKNGKFTGDFFGQ